MFIKIPLHLNKWGLIKWSELDCSRNKSRVIFFSQNAWVNINNMLDDHAVQEFLEEFHS